MNVLVRISDRLIVNLAQVVALERQYRDRPWWLWLVGRANAVELSEAEYAQLQRCLADVGGKYRDLTEDKSLNPVEQTTKDYGAGTS